MDVEYGIQNMEYNYSQTQIYKALYCDWLIIIYIDMPLVAATISEPVN